MILALQTATFCLVMTDGKDMDIDIKDLARAHAMAAIDVLAEIMTNPNAPAAARISAAKTLLDRGFGKVTTQKSEERADTESREAPILRIERVIIDPKEPGVETPAPIDPPESCRYPWQPANDRLPSEDQAVLGQQVENQAQRAPPAVGDYSDYTRTGGDGWG